LETYRSNAARRWALTLLFGLIRAIGLILLGFGVVQIGLSLKGHDPSQRANGFMTFAGGIVIFFAREILTLITGA
jgi:sulfite exporter TauE/SafE